MQRSVGTVFIASGLSTVFTDTRTYLLGHEKSTIHDGQEIIKGLYQVFDTLDDGLKAKVRGFL